jgi:hypothetical protein
MKRGLKIGLTIGVLVLMAVVVFQSGARAEVNAIKSLVKDKIIIITVRILSGSNTGTSTTKAHPSDVILGVNPTASDNVSFTNNIKTVTLNDNGTITVVLSNVRTTGSDNLTLTIPVLKR